MKPYLVKYFKWLLRVIKGQRAHSAFRGTVPFGTLYVSLQSHFQVCVASQPIVDISVMLWLLIISSHDLSGATIQRGDNSRVIFIKLIGISNLAFFWLAHKWNTICVSNMLGTQLQSTLFSSHLEENRHGCSLLQTPPLISCHPRLLLTQSTTP